MADIKHRWAAVLTVAAIGLTACSAPHSGESGGAATPSAISMSEAVSVPSTPPSTPTLDDQLLSIIEGWTPQQKAGQLVIVGLLNSDSLAALDPMITQEDVGGVVLLGTWKNPDAVKRAIEHLNSVMQQADAKLYIAVDQEGGQVQRVSGPGFDTIPPATDQGALPVDQLTQVATTWGGQLKSIGVNLNLAPVADTVPPGFESKNGPIGRQHREFGTSPDVTGTHAAAFVAGMNAAGEQACVKHFPGLGRIVGNTDTTAKGITDDTTSPTDPYLDAFRTAIAANPAMVMVSLATYNQIDGSGPAVFSHVVVTDLLRAGLGWQGVVISDSMGATAVGHIPADQLAVRFIQAGGDITIIDTVGDATAAIDGLVAAMGQSADIQNMVDASVLRVLKAKYAAGLVTI